MFRVGIVDYGLGNLRSIYNALESLDVKADLIKSPQHLAKSDFLILPGVGNFSEASQRLESFGWMQAIREDVLVNSKPILGICLGMQLLADNGYEGLSSNDHSGGAPGLGFIPGTVINILDLGKSVRVPHVGWNSVNYRDYDNKLFESIPSDTDFYFVHSYVFSPVSSEHIVATTDYQELELVAAVNYKNIWGTQFHPEKSSKAGTKILHNFLHNSKC